MKPVVTDKTFCKMHSTYLTKHDVSTADPKRYNGWVQFFSRILRPAGIFGRVNAATTLARLYMLTSKTGVITVREGQTVPQS